MDRRSIAILEFPQVRERLANLTSFPPSRRLAEHLEPSDEPVIVDRGLDETDQVRRLLSERPSVGIGAAHDIGPAIERAARGGRLEPAQFLEIAETLDAVARLATSLGDERRPLLRDLARGLHPLPGLRTTLARSFDPVGELLDTASPRLGGLRAAVRTAYDRLRRRLEQLVGSSRARRRPAGLDRHAPQRALRRAGQGRRALAGEGHRPRRVIERADAVRGAARGGGARQRVARGADRRRSRRSTGSSTNCPVSSPRTPSRSANPSMRSRASTSGPRRRSSPGRWTPPAPDARTASRSCC